MHPLVMSMHQRWTHREQPRSWANKEFVASRVEKLIENIKTLKGQHGERHELGHYLVGEDSGGQVKAVDVLATVKDLHRAQVAQATRAA